MRKLNNEVTLTDADALADLLGTQRPDNPSKVLCMCKDRTLGACPGEWEPGCDLGNNPVFCKVRHE